MRAAIGVAAAQDLQVVAVEELAGHAGDDGAGAGRCGGEVVFDRRGDVPFHSNWVGVTLFIETGGRSLRIPTSWVTRICGNGTARQGVRVIIFTNDHQPEHVHVFGDGEAKINLRGPDGAPHLVWADGMNRGEVRRAMRVVAGL